jgi:ComF family protein
MGESGQIARPQSSRRPADASGTGRARVPEMVRRGAGPRGDEGLTPLTGPPRDAIRAFVAGVLDLALPRVCISCEQLMSRTESGMVCHLCWSRLPRLASPQCERCGHPIVAAKCQWCDLLPPYVRCVRSVCWMPIEPASSIVHGLKYSGWAKVADEMGERMSRLAWPEDVVEERAGIVPIPLASARKRERGYNQSELLARGLSRRWDIPVWPDVVRRARETESQTRLTPEQRQGNVAGSFAIGAKQDAVADAHIVIVDDVVTTAATLNECAKVLYRAGARIISYVTFGRAHASGDRL